MKRIAVEECCSLPLPVLASDDLLRGQDSEVHNRCEGLWNFTAPWGGKHWITVCRLWCSLTSLPVETRVAQNLDQPDYKLQNLVYNDLSLFTHVFALDRDEFDCKLQNLVSGNLTSWLLHVFCPGFRWIGLQVAESGAFWPVFLVASRVAQAVKPEYLARELHMPSVNWDTAKWCCGEAEVVI